MSEKPLVQIAVTADPSCPFCLVGYEKLRTAIYQSKDKYKFIVYFRTYLLNPDIPQEGLNFKDFYKKKGKDMDVEKMAKLLADLQQNKKVLLNLAADTGIDQNAAFLFLQDDNNIPTREQMVQVFNQNKKLTDAETVPHFTFNEADQVPGTQEPEDFINLFEKYAIKQ
ncbi:Thioredoxin-like fold [Pseudocohnilembus persalinus]|uniref:Thioredoxin-like fold n=1 Tax=Pseudocohnilembus persalinus TaxID=266149 RepID=A0A0V0QHK7_PSEPJ|nr:Thioredoxin-like fold [Pseudocohnilembus persalinus]|eukprot:KRX01763.1 Thioredoxin-like fold [Pseudocohnilembus persalinus]